MILAVPHIDVGAVLAHPSGSTQQVIGALVMVMTGFGLGRFNIAADWSRCQRRGTSDGTICVWNTIGESAAPAILVVFGPLLAGSYDGLRVAVGDDTIGALASIIPLWALLPFLITLGAPSPRGRNPHRRRPVSPQADWNHWQGYLLVPLGGRDGDWAYANLGVLISLVLLSAITWFARKGAIRCQEEVSVP